MPGMTTETDVIVVGGGGAALAAASAAAEVGARVILLEKNPALGGSTAWSVGSVTATGTPHQQKKGIQDNVADHFEDLKKFSGELAHRDNFDLARVLAEGTPDMFRWLLSAGLRFLGPFPEPPHRQPRMHNVLPNSRAFPYLLGRHCRRQGVDIRLSTRAHDLVTEGGHVSGVLATLPDGTRHKFIALGGVILAAGDFSASPELKLRYASELTASVDAVNPTSTGDGIRMGVEAGGVVVNGDYIRGPILRFVPPPARGLLHRLPPAPTMTGLMSWAFEHLPPAILRPFLMSFLTTALAPERAMYANGTVLIDLEGHRFTNECQQPERDAALRPKGMAYLLFDDKVARMYGAWPHFVSTAPSIGYAYLDDYRRTRPDIFHRADTLEALASRMGVSATALRHSVGEYNTDTAADGRLRRNGRPMLDTPPYYALGPAKAYIIFTNGGLRVDHDTRVLDGGGLVIPGLYAAGSTGQGGLVLEGHGHHLGWAFTSGRLAGRNAAFESLTPKT